jgi:hypothetical protein
MNSTIFFLSVFVLPASKVAEGQTMVLLSGNGN